MTGVNDLQRLMVADLIGREVRIAVVRGGPAARAHRRAHRAAVMSAAAPPTVYAWAGGLPAFERLTEAFYTRVRADELLAPVFAHMPADHPHHVALWLAEVFGGPAEYTAHHGGYPHMLGKHKDLAITEQQRFRWVTLIALAADDAGLPGRPRVPLRLPRLHRVGHAAGAAQLAARRAARRREAPVPHWGWGEAPPYEG